MAKKHTNISDEQQMALADIQANPKLLFTPEYSKWRDFLRRESPNYVDSLYNNLPQDVQYDIYMNNREGFGALSDKVKNNYKANLGAKQTRGAIEDAGKFIWDEVVPWVPVLGTAKDWGEFFADPTLENLAWAGLGTISDAGVVKGIRRMWNGVKSKELLNSVDAAADSRKSNFVNNFDLGKDASKNAQSYLSDLQKRGVLSAKEVVDYSDRLADARNANEVSIIQDELRRKASNNINKGVALTTAGTAVDVFLANEQRLQQQGEEPWLINISSQPWAKWNLIEDVPYIIQGAEPDPRDYANGGRLRITKKGTYRPHYFGGDSPWESNQIMTLQANNNGTWGSSGELSPTGQLQNTQVVSPYSNMPNLTIDPNQGSTNNSESVSTDGNSGSGMNWGSIGWGIAGGATAALDQIGKSERNPRGYWDLGDPMHYLANGRTSKVGNGLEDTGVAVTKAGISTGNPWVMLAGAGLKITGDLANAGWGYKTDEEQLARVKQGIDAANNFQSNATSFDTLQNPMVLANAENMYGAGWFNKKKARRKSEELQEEAMAAQANVYNQYNNNLNNLQQDQMNNMLANYAAFGGPLHTHGSDWTNGITYVDNGGSHESNPYGGVPMGIAQDGQPNLVEEGEVIYKLNGSPYVYSKRLKMSKELKDKYKFKGDTFADGALEAQKESEERPNDPISQRGLNAIMSDLANEQEKKRAEKAERQAKYAFGGHLFPWGGRVYFNGNIYRKTEKGDYVPESGVGQTLLESDLDEFWRGAGGAGVYDVTPEIENEYNRLRNSGLSLSDIDNGMINYIALGGMERRREAKAAAFDRLPTQGFISQKPVNTEVANQVESNEIEAAKPVEAVPLTDQMAGNPYYGTVPSPLQQSSGWRSFLLTPDITTTPSAATTNVAPSTSTPTSKSTSTSKGTSTTGVKANRAVDQAGWADAKNWWLNTATDDEFNAVNALFNNRFKDRNALAAYAESGNIGRAYDAISKGYSNYANSIAASNQAKQADEAWNNYMSYVTSGNWQNPQVQTEPTTTEVETETKKEAEDVNNPIDNYKTWMRYAPIFGSGLALALDPWINRPDYTNADLVLEAGKSAGNVDFNPIGDYLPYKPYDRLFYANQLAANQAATRRALLNTTGGNAAAARGLLLAADNQGINQMGNLWRQAEEYNEANRQAIAEFNRGTNMFNSEGRLKADMANQGQANVRINAAIEAAKLRALEDDRVAETRSANFTNFLDNLGDLGRENLYYNMVNNNNALYYGQNKRGESIYKGEGSTNNPVTMPMPIQQYTKTGKNGGYLTIKKKKK